MCRGAIALCAVLLGGCLQSASQHCAGDLVCTADKLCDDVHGLCISQQQRDVCVGATDGDACVFGTQQGSCDAGVCVPRTCGNSVEELGEACDDGNQDSGDGCRGDCVKLEACGDEVVDANEACDDANDNPSDGCDACAGTVWRATPLVGGTANKDAIAFLFPRDIAVDLDGNVYVADTGADRVRRVDRGGVVLTIAGSSEGYSGDGGPATSAQLSLPQSIAVDGLGNVYIADLFNRRLRRVDAGGRITTIAGNGTTFNSGGIENVPATSISVQAEHVAVDGLGNIFIIEDNRIRHISTAGIITTLAGTTAFGFSGDGGVATSATLNNPAGITVREGNIYIADTSNHRVRRIDTVGIITTVAGSGASSSSGDGGPATSAGIPAPTAVAFDASGDMYIAAGQKIRRVDANGMISTIAGTGTAGFSGDGGPALAAQLGGVTALEIVGSTIFICDEANRRVRRIDNGTITTHAGNGRALGYDGEGHLATSSTLRYPRGMALDGAGNLYIADENARVRKLAPNGVITTVAGTGSFGFAGDGGPATAARLSNPYDVAVDASGTLFIADLTNRRVRRVDSLGVITTVAGTGFGGTTGDGGLATAARVTPWAIEVDAVGNLYIADTDMDVIRRVDTNGIITTFAGIAGSGGFSGDGGPATSAQLSGVFGLDFDAAGNLYIADTYNARIRRIDANGVITTVVGPLAPCPFDNCSGFAGDGGPPTSARLNDPSDVAIAPNGDIVIIDRSNQRLRRVSNGIINTIAGTGQATFDGDGGPAAAAIIANPDGVLVDGAGNIYLGDTPNHHVRKIDATGVITSVAGQTDPEEMGPVATARLADPRALAVTAGFTLFAGGSSGTVQMLRNGWLEVVAGRYPHPTATPGKARFLASNFGHVGGVAFDEAAGRIYMTERNRIYAVQIVDPANAKTWTLSTLANATNQAGFADGAVATAAFRNPTGLYLDTSAKQLYVADTGNHVIRAIDLVAGTVGTIAGRPVTLGFGGDGGVATAALLYSPRAITRCTNGDLFIADAANHRVRRVAATTNTITTVLGDGVAGSSGEGAPSINFPVHDPQGLACDARGNLFVTSSAGVRLVSANRDGQIDGTTAVTTIYGRAPREQFPESVTRCLAGIAVIDDATVQVTDGCTGILLELRREVAP